MNEQMNEEPKEEAQEAEEPKEQSILGDFESLKMENVFDELVFDFRL